MDGDTQRSRARSFRLLHKRGDPLLLVNIWDAGSARIVAEAGARAIATASWAVAAAHGFEDGECIPLELALANLERISAAVELPVSLDLESGYADNPSGVFASVEKALRAGAVGFNLEDRVPSDGSIRTIEQQCERISSAREAADQGGIRAFVNARCDLFLSSPVDQHRSLLGEALRRAESYERAGADGFFAPGLWQEDVIAELCKGSPLPLNLMLADETPPMSRLVQLGIARVSYGPRAYRMAMQTLNQAARQGYNRSTGSWQTPASPSR